MNNDYEMIGTSQKVIQYKIAMEKLSKEDVKKFLKEKMEDQIKLIENKKCIAEKEGNTVKIKELEYKIDDIRTAYRRIIHGELEENDSFNIKENKEKKKEKTERSPYEVLDCSKEDVLKLKPVEVDLILEIRAKFKKMELSKKLESIPINRYTERANLEKQIQEIKDAYEKIKSEDARKIYANLAQKRINEDFENLKAAVEKPRNEIKGEER